MEVETESLIVLEAQQFREAVYHCRPSLFWVLERSFLFLRNFVRGDGAWLKHVKRIV